MNKLSIVIPNWNGLEKLQKNLPKLLEIVKGKAEVIIVDDVSADASADFIKNNYPEIKLIINSKNIGFAASVNKGVKRAQAEIVFLLNNDALPKVGFLDPALKHFKDAKVFSVGCNVGNGAWAFANFANGWFWHHCQQLQEQKFSYHKTLWVSGGSGFFKKSIWENLGGFDELYKPFYEEDVDLGYRAIKRGYINIWESQSVVEHYKVKGVIASHFSQEYIQRVAQRNQLLFIWKNITDRGLFKEHQKALAKKLAMSPSYWMVFLSAIYRLAEVKKRRKIEKLEAKLTDKEALASINAD